MLDSWDHKDKHSEAMRRRANPEVAAQKER